MREIIVMYGRCIDSIRFVYDKNGKPASSEKHGGGGGSKTAEVKLKKILFFHFSPNFFCSTLTFIYLFPTDQAAVS